jgi:post-segregation antitoxin (ccd killing protein)
MSTSRTTFTMDDDLAERARTLGVNISAAARQGVTNAVRAALEKADREAYEKLPESVDASWTEVEVWGQP